MDAKTTQPTRAYEEFGHTAFDFEDHVALQDGSKHMVLVETIYDDGENVGPENVVAVCYNAEKAHTFVQKRFNKQHIHCERVSEDFLSCYRLFFTGDKESNMTITLRLVELA
jgi:hypothetical protein